MSEEQLFLSEDQVDQLTGLLRGKDGKSKHDLQCVHLREKGIVHFVNARGRPVVPLTAINGQRQVPARPKWQPTLV
jgi:hypothetical protein